MQNQIVFINVKTGFDDLDSGGFKQESFEAVDKFYGFSIKQEPMLVLHELENANLDSSFIKHEPLHAADKHDGDGSNLGDDSKPTTDSQLKEKLTKDHSCLQCDRKFPRNLYLQEHIVHAHTHEYRYFCRFCQKGHYLRSRNNRHEERVHIKSKPPVKHVKKEKQERFKCTQCGEKFTCNNFLQNHVVMTHTHEYRYHCGICGKGFFLKSARDRHHKKPTVHSETLLPRKNSLIGMDRSYNAKWVCEYCSKIFTSCYNFSRHLKVHQLPEVEYKCDICDKKVSSSAMLSIHKRTHTGERPFLCEHCGRGFVSKGDYNVHLDKVHGGVIKRYKCNVCHKKFKFYGKLKTHYVHFHSEVDIPEEHSVLQSDLNEETLNK